MIVYMRSGVIESRELAGYAKLISFANPAPIHAEHHKSRTRQISRHTVEILSVRRPPRLELDERGRTEAARTIARDREQGQ